MHTIKDPWTTAKLTHLSQSLGEAYGAPTNHRSHKRVQDPWTTAACLKLGQNLADGYL